MSAHDSFEVLLDADAVIVDFNEEACEVTGYSKNEVIGENWFMIFIPEPSIAKMIDMFVDTFYGISSYNKYANEIILKDGSKKLINWYDTVVKDENDRPLHLHSTGLYI